MVIIAVALAWGCSSDPAVDPGNTDPGSGTGTEEPGGGDPGDNPGDGGTEPGESIIMLFNSGFEAGTEVVPAVVGEQKMRVTGTDLSVSAPNKWGTITRNDIPSFVRNIGPMIREGEDSLYSYAKIIPDPTQIARPNKVMVFRIIDIAPGKEKSRVQLDAGGTNLTDFYQSVRVYFHPDMAYLKQLARAYDWLTLLEWWNDSTTAEAWENGTVYRLSLNLAKAAGVGENLYFDIHGQDVTRPAPGAASHFENVWSDRNTSIPIQYGKWFTMETHFKEGDASTGQFTLTIQFDGEEKQTVFDIQGRTKGANKTEPGVYYFSPLKFYSGPIYVTHMKDGGKTFEVLWDDLKIWTK